MENNKGYTLIEILVVISIIGFVAAAAMYSLNNARIKSRDVRRLADMDAISKAMKLYYNNNDEYPGDGGWYYNDTCVLTYTYSDTISSLLSPQYLSSAPNDPNNNIEINPNFGCYWYQMRNAGQGYVLLMQPENDSLFDEDMDCAGGYYCIGENWD